MKTLYKWIAVLSVVGALSGCARTVPIALIHESVGMGHSENQIRYAIMNAGAQHKWIMTDVAPGLIKGRLQVRDHMVEVSIPYSTKSYSINYESSQNLKAKNGMIHKSYNRWVRNLNQNIQLNIASASQL